MHVYQLPDLCFLNVWSLPLFLAITSRRMAPSIQRLSLALFGLMAGARENYDIVEHGDHGNIAGGNEGHGGITINGDVNIHNGDNIYIDNCCDCEEVIYDNPNVPEEPVKPEPVKPEPVKPEPVKPEPVKPEPVKPEPVKPEPVKPEPVKPEPVKPTTPIAPAEPEAAPGCCKTGQAERSVCLQGIQRQGQAADPAGLEPSSLHQRRRPGQHAGALSGL